MLIRLPPDLHDGLTRLRTERHINISAWLRSLLARELDCELGPDRDPPIPLSRLLRLARRLRPRLPWMLRSQAGGPTAWTTGPGAPSISAILLCCPLISPGQPSSCSRETASPDHHRNGGPGP